MSNKNRSKQPRIVKDLAGERFNRWLVLRFDRADRVGQQWVKFWWCRCDCGTERAVRAGDLTSEKSRSCGCWNDEQIRARVKDITGQRFGRLVVLSQTMPAGKRSRWLCQCDCGTVKEINANELRSEDTISCGCQARERFASMIHKHGQHGSPTYQTWRGMIARCHSPNAAVYADYGGRGIKVCDRWHQFENFLADMGERPDGQTIERKDFRGHYEPSNCEWLPRSKQNFNTSRNRMLTFNGQTLCLAQWAEETGIPIGTISIRLARGWNVDRILGTPARKGSYTKRAHSEKSIWQNMIYRCHHENCPDYIRYGAKGIAVCDRWRDSFDAFLEDMGPRPSPEHSLDRYPNHQGNYEPGNVRWATYEEQGNNKRTSRFLEFDGQRLTVSQWARRIGVSKVVITTRLKAGWSVEDTLTTPPHGKTTS